MCGFAGIFNASGAPVSQMLLEKMAHCIAHRGPDDSGIEIFSAHAQTKDNIGFAFRRLAIIDLTPTGHQPMHSDDHRITLMFNGEIYNADALRIFLQAKGHRFRGSSDTEVILRLYEEQGITAFSQLNGMFAIALHDTNTGKLHLARDRLGIKPLYYAQTTDTLVFASEIKAIFCHPKVARAFDPVSIVDYMSFQFCLNEQTLFAGISLLSPASILTFDTEKSSLTAAKQRFWQWQYRPDTTRSLASFAEELRARLEDTLTRQMRSDVPVGTFLSSGMDTGAISALGVRHLPHMHSFTCGFDTSYIKDDEKLFDEREDAEALAKYLGTKHHTLTLGASAMRDYFTQTNWHMESPQVGISYQILAMAQTIKPHTSVALSGTGGDELFAGYHWRYKGFDTLQTKQQIDAALYQQWCRLLNDETRWDILSDELRISSDSANPRERFEATMAECDSEEPLARMLYFELHGFLHGLLQLDDKLNMAHSVEARVPLLDNEILDLAETIPSSMKYDGFTTKIVLKEALRGILPEQVIDRRKQGFTPPDDYTMRHQNRAWLEEQLNTPHFASMQLFNPEAVAQIVQAHMTGANNHRFLLWSLLCLNSAHSLYIEDSGNHF